MISRFFFLILYLQERVFRSESVRDGMLCFDKNGGLRVHSSFFSDAYAYLQYEAVDR